MQILPGANLLSVSVCAVKVAFCMGVCVFVMVQVSASRSCFQIVEGNLKENF